MGWRPNPKCHTTPFKASSIGMSVKPLSFKPVSSSLGPQITSHLRLSLSNIPIRGYSSSGTELRKALYNFTMDRKQAVVNFFSSPSCSKSEGFTIVDNVGEMMKQDPNFDLIRYRKEAIMRSKNCSLNAMLLSFIAFFAGSWLGLIFIVDTVELWQGILFVVLVSSTTRAIRKDLRVYFSIMRVEHEMQKLGYEFIPYVKIDNTIDYETVKIKPKEPSVQPKP